MAQRPGRRGGHSGESLREPALAMRMGSEARRISAQHRQLDLFYGMLEESLQRGSLRGARVAFVRFHDALEAHISLEDQVFFPALRGLRPEFESELAALVDEHASIRVDLDHLHDLLSEGALDECSECLGRLATVIAGHEEREESLMARIHENGGSRA
ncbi:MAG: hemerythrin domain-containing protein [Myxococcota bacterium]